MNWNTKDVSLFIQQKKYMDTALVPLAQAAFGQEIMQSAEQFEFTSLITSFLEKQFKGRLLVTPPYIYLQDDGQKLTQAATWCRQLESEGFQHIFFLTSDPYWKGREADMGKRASVILASSVPIGSMEETMKYSVIENQGKQLVNTIIENWQKQV